MRSQQQEIVRAGQKVKSESLAALVNDLNAVEEDPLNSRELKKVLHSRGIPMRYLGKICTTAELNHTREIAVIEVITRAAKLLIKEGLVFLSEDEDAAFTGNNIKRCIQHYLHEIFYAPESTSSAGQKSKGAQNIWDFISDHARRKYNITIERDVLKKIHLNSLFTNILEKLNIKLRVPV